jgi:RNA polymerase sigma-70 factor (ECF subfamily)
MQSAVASAASDDSDVVELLRASGRERAFALLLPRYERKVFRLCCALLRNPTQAQDAAQESLVRIWKALPGYDGRASLSSWIYTITRNRCLTAIERRRAHAALSDSELDLESQAAEVALGPESESEERSAQLRELIDLLPERARRTLVLFYFEQRSISEVAQQLGCPEGTVKTHLFRARAALAALLKQRGLDDPSLWLETST